MFLWGIDTQCNIAVCHHWVVLRLSWLYLWHKQKWYPFRHCLEAMLLFAFDIHIPVILAALPASGQSWLLLCSALWRPQLQCWGSSGLPSTRDVLQRPAKGHKGDRGTEVSLPTRKGWKSWNSSVWMREGSGDPVNVYISINKQNSSHTFFVLQSLWVLS